GELVLGNGNWFDNKELYLLINDLQKDMQETRSMIRKYNGLYDKVESVKYDIDEVKSEVDEIKAVQQGKKDFSESIKSWSGWVVAILTFVFMLIKFYSGV